MTHRKFIVSCRQRGEERSNLGCSMSNWQSKQQQQQEKTKKLPAGRSHKAEGEVQRSQAAGGERRSRRGGASAEVEVQGGTAAEVEEQQQRSRSSSKLSRSSRRRTGNSSSPSPPPLLPLPILLRHLCLALDTFCYGIFATDDAVALKPRRCRQRRRRRLC